MASYRTCIEISPECPVEATTYGYFPVLWANVLFCVIFGLCSLGQLVMGSWFKTWTWMATISMGCLLEFAGYLGRSFMHHNPWSTLPAGFSATDRRNPGNLLHEGFG